MSTTPTATKQSTSTSNTDTSSMDFISHLVGNGLSNSFEALKEKVSASIKDNGEEYLHDALEKLKKSAAHLTEWSKQNPVKTGVAVAAVLAVTAFLVSTANSSSSAATPAARSTSTPRKSASSAGSRKSASKSA